MFERYTEKARRVIFFSRYEASHFPLAPNQEVPVCPQLFIGFRVSRHYGKRLQADERSLVFLTFLYMNLAC